MRSGKVRPITTEDLAKALDGARATTAEWLGSARNYVKYANEGGLYDEVANYLAAAG